MFYAIDEVGTRLAPLEKSRALCPTCRTEVRAKTGKVVTWHWAHTQRECDPFSEPMTAWHREWQGLFPEHCREFVIGPHRADVFAPVGCIVELQHSSISVDEIHERETFYQHMVWVFDAIDAAYDWTRDPAKSRQVEMLRRSEGYVFGDPRLSIRGRGKRSDGYVTFRWKHPRKSLAACTKPVYLDIGGSELLRLGRVHLEAPCGGWGYLTTKAEFVTSMTKVGAP